MHHLFTVNCALLILLVVSSNAYGSAWTLAKNKIKLIVTQGYYHASSYTDNTGNRQTQPDYDKFYFNPYIEYGLSSDLTVGTNIFFNHVYQSPSSNQTDLNSINTGLGDIELFVRKQLWVDSNFAFAIQPIFQVPSLMSSAPKPQIGSIRPETGLGLIGGYGFDMYGYHHFINMSAEYRHRFGPENDRIKLSTTAGIQLAPQWMLIPELFIIQRTSHNENKFSFAQSDSNDYNLTTAQLSAVYQITKDTSIQVGGFYALDAKNTGNGRGILIAIWKDL